MGKTTATNHTLPSSWDLLKPNFALIREHYVAVMYLFLLPGLVTSLGSVLIGNLGADGNSMALSTQQIMGLIVLLIGILLEAVLAGPITYFLLRATDGKVDSLGDYYCRGLRYSWPVVVYYVTFTLLVLAGLILFIIPGLMVIRRYALGGYYLVDKDLSVKEAFKMSAKDSKPVSKAIWGVIGVQLLIGLAAVIIQEVFAYVGIILGQLIACSYIFLFVLRYREIQPKTKR
jgi:hypothetical protein